jgi:hypothetical protein
MRLTERLKHIAERLRPSPPAAPPERRRRRDPDWSSLPGGSSVKEAEQGSAGRARELAD